MATGQTQIETIEGTRRTRKLNMCSMQPKLAVVYDETMETSENIESASNGISNDLGSKQNGNGVERKISRQEPPENAKITQELREKLMKLPAKNRASFCIEGVPRKISVDDNNAHHWKWNDPTYVRLPISPLNIGPSSSGGEVRNWDTIVIQLERIRNFCEDHISMPNVKVNIGREFIAMVNSYCPEAHHLSDFGILARPDLQEVLLETIPTIVNYALKLPNLLSEPIPILGNGESRTVHLTRKLCCSLLANAFFCTFPPTVKDLQIPDFNFFRLFNHSNPERREVKGEKLKCILNYFQVMKKMGEEFQSEIVSFVRRCIREKDDWENSHKRLCKVRIEPNIKLEDADSMLQVDFAHKLIGSGVFGDCIFMEEVRFSISPELIVARLITEQLDDDEVVIIIGTQAFSKYKGYHMSFKFDGPHPIKPSNRDLDELGRTLNQIVAMDAIAFKKDEAGKQYEKQFIDRELHKCKVAFVNDMEIFTHVATGHWGCGSYNGNIELKFLIQWMAASQSECPWMQFHTLRDRQLTGDIHVITKYLQKKKITVGRMYEILLLYNFVYTRNPEVTLFVFMKRNIGGHDICDVI